MTEPSLKLLNWVQKGESGTGLKTKKATTEEQESKNLMNVALVLEKKKRF